MRKAGLTQPLLIGGATTSKEHVAVKVSPHFFIAVALGIVLFVLVWLRRDPPGWPGLIAAGVLIGGALGNVVDRLIYGAVADFLNMSCCGIDNPYAFNVADIAIFAGAAALVLFPGTPKSGQRKKRA